MLPFWRRGVKISKKSTGRIKGRAVALGVLVSGSVIVCLNSYARGETFDNEEAFESRPIDIQPSRSSPRRLESLEIEELEFQRVSNSSSRQLQTTPVTPTKHACQNPEYLAPCGGECKDRSEMEIKFGTMIDSGCLKWEKIVECKTYENVANGRQRCIKWKTEYGWTKTTGSVTCKTWASWDSSVCEEYSFDKPQLKSDCEWKFAMYLFNLFYMFIAIAIVCDEFFVPALECFVDEFGISMDVAGATFMAAGGSMPELCTNFVATFDESAVGFQAIVGSAVFNVLFVIGVCAYYSAEPLHLTWYPLARDCSFYLFTILTVWIVFQVTSEEKIYTAEAIVLLLEYILYCIFMKFNSRILAFAESKFGKSSKVAPGDTDADGRPSLTQAIGDIDDPQNPHFAKPGTFRVGIVQLLTQSAYLHETAGIAAVTQIKGDLDQTFKALDKDQDGLLNAEELKELLVELGIKPDSQTIKAAMQRITRTGADHITFEAFKKWYLASEARIECEVQRIFDKFDKDRNGLLEAHEIKAVLRHLGHKTEDEDVMKWMTEIMAAQEEKMKEEATKSCTGSDKVESMQEGDAPPAPPAIGDEEEKLATPKPIGMEAMPTEVANVKINLDQFEAWYQKSMFYQSKMKHEELEAEAEECHISLDAPSRPPKNPDPLIDRRNTRLWISAMCWYVVTYPLVCMLYCTLPDVRAEKYQRNWRVAVIEFTLSLVWIAIFANWLYECLYVVSCTLGIPMAVSSVTLLAGGTSVPDLLSSYIVAKNGEGDMAVSSSIGSNIFDVTVGLPVPWLLYTIVKDKPVVVQAKGLGFSMLVLVVMIMAVVLSIMAFKWRMTKSMGVVMMVLYVIFIVQYLLQNLPNEDDAPFSPAF